MKRAVFILMILFLGFTFAMPQTADSNITKPKIILLIAEQNIPGPQNK